MSTSDSRAPLPAPKRSLHRHFRSQTRQRLMEQFENGEQSLTEFCEQHGLCRSSRWRWRWLAQRRREQMGAGALVEVSGYALQVPVTASTVTAAGTVKMQLITGARLEIAAGTDPTWLAALIRAPSAAGV